MPLHRLARRVRGQGTRVAHSTPPPTPAAMKRRMLGQALIDRLLQVSGPVARPAGARLEKLWLDALAVPGLSRAAGRLADQRLPRPLLAKLIDAWIATYDVDMSVADVPPEGFATLDAFFTRALKPGARPIDHDPDVLVSPADSVLKAFGEVDARGRVPEVKGRTYAIDALVAGVVPVGDFVGGTYGVYYLSPRDYHRVHAPTSGVVRAVVPIEGATYPVNALGVRRVEGLFVRNKRTVFALVMVGATNVGRITASVAVGDRVERGQELGVFHLGSTVVWLTPQRARFAYSHVHEGELVKVGQPVLHRALTPRGL